MSGRGEEFRRPLLLLLNTGSFDSALTSLSRSRCCAQDDTFKKKALQMQHGPLLLSSLCYVLPRSFMRALIAFAMAIPMSTLAAAQTLPVPQAVTDPKQIASKPNGTVEKNLSIEKLFMTRQ